MKALPSIDDLRERARRNVPKMFFDYADAGSYNQETLRANRADFEKIKLRQRILRDVDQRSTATTILGEPVPLPLALGPIGLGGMMHGDGEIMACRAAQAAGIPYTLSTMSINSIEDVAAAVDKPFWFQLYVMRDRGFIRELIQRAAAAKCSALMLTVDLQVLGQRHVDVRNGLTVPPEIKLKNVLDIMTKPAWAWSILKGKSKTFGNLSGHVKGMENINSLAAWTASQFDPTLSWKDVEWVKSLWPGKLILKGILDVGDDRRGRDQRVQSRRPPARRRAVGDLGAAAGGRRGRFRDRGDVRFRRPHRRRYHAGAGARRPFLHRRPFLYLRARRRRAGRRRQRYRNPAQGVRCDHGAVRREKHGRDQPRDACRHRAAMEAAMKLSGPDHPITIKPATERVRVTFNGKVVADSKRALVLQEAAYKPVFYIPREDAQTTLFERTTNSTHCPYKGDASYYTIKVGDRAAENAIWSYETPFPAMKEIEGHLAFYPNRVDAIEVTPA